MSSRRENFFLITVVMDKHYPRPVNCSLRCSDETIIILNHILVLEIDTNQKIDTCVAVVQPLIMNLETAFLTITCSLISGLLHSLK